jgi:fructoselysine 6-kinase
MPRILGIGDNTVDIYVDAGMQYPGGNAVNVAVLTRRLGATSSYLGCLGKDAAGQLIFDSLRAEGIDLSHCRRIEGANAWSRIAHRGADRVFAGSDPGVRARYGLCGEDYTYIGQHHLAHTSIYSDLEDELPRIRAVAPTLSFDYSEEWQRPRTKETLKHVDLAFLSHPRGSVAECRDLMAWCAGRGPSTVVVTRGLKGSLAYVGGRHLTQRAVEAEVVDTLGAGDAFIAAFLMAYLEHQDPAAALQAGAEYAAAACSYKGAFGHGHPIRRPTDAQAPIRNASINEPS